tara:strand:- start:67 stop:1119 length:1053 start_codon:yes stop_codon:yes gene_type:complete
MAYTTIDKPSEHFNTVTYSGSETPQTITGVNFSADMAWFKSRTGTAAGGNIYDTVRGISDGWLYTNEADASNNSGQPQITLNSDGYVLNSGYNVTNDGSSTYVSWNWKGANGTASNTNGDVTTTVSANQTAGFSIVSYTVSGGSAYNTGHGLSEAPELVLWKSRDRTASWSAYAKGIGNAKKLVLDTNGGEANTGGWNSTTPTNTLFSHGGYYDGDNIIYYAFHSVKGYSKISKYTGNGSSSVGPFIYTGFKPAFILRKRTDTTGSWLMQDNKRPGSNRIVTDSLPSNNSVLYSQTNESELFNNELDILSNGFKLRATDTFGNAAGGTYIYLAIAENPFVTSTGIPATAR